MANNIPTVPVPAPRHRRRRRRTSQADIAAGRQITWETYQNYLIRRAATCFWNFDEVRSFCFQHSKTALVAVAVLFLSHHVASTPGPPALAPALVLVARSIGPEDEGKGEIPGPVVR